MKIYLLIVALATLNTINHVHSQQALYNDSVYDIKEPEDRYLFRDPAQYASLHRKGKFDFWYRLAEYCDFVFEFFGYHYMPHTMRYAIVGFFIVSPLYTLFFIYCMMAEDVEEDPEEEKLF